VQTATAPAGSNGAADNKTLQLPTSAFAKIKADAQEKGRKAAQAELAEKAKAFGFANMDEMFAALESVKSGGEQEAAPAAPKAQGPKAQQQGGKPQQSKQSDTVSAEALRVAKELERARKEAEKASREARRYRQQLEEQQATAEIEKVALQAGVRELDFTVDLLKRTLSTKTEEELASFSVDQWFAGLRSQRPYLFGEAPRVPATTGTGGEAPKAPAPGQAAAAAAQNSQFDGRKATSDAVRARLAQLGVDFSRV
jgi:hypothetical protein